MFKFTTSIISILVRAPKKLIRSLSLATETMVNKLCAIFVLCVHIICSTGLKNEPIVTVKQGKLQGAVATLHDGSSYYSFKGIPYAQPPVGPLRFRAPQPPQPWEGILNATEHRNVCAQFNLLARASAAEGSEDCLFLNVYSKSLQPSAKTPVMVYIHGGAYLSGSGNDDMYGPQFLLQHNVVLVTLNYRLEVLGFLCLDTPEVPGNAGMKDQVAAMKWVKENIAQFGGDPDNITLFGESAGASSVIYHMLSPMSQGLFHKAITQSGTSINDWAQGVNGKERAFKIGKHLGRDTKDPQELLDFLRSLPVSKLVRLTNVTLTPDEKYRGLPIHFAPVQEKKFPNVEAFLSENPLNLILSNKICSIPLMLGYNSAESIIMVQDRLKKQPIYNKTPSFDVPREIVDKINQEKLIEMGDRIKQFYVGNRDYSSEDLKEMVQLLSDLHFVYNTHRFAYLYSRHNSAIYMYRFNIETDLNIIKNMSGVDVAGVSHADELFYIFSTNMTKEDYESQEKIRDYVWRVTKMWTDFAKTGNPTPDSTLGVKWPQYTVANKEYLQIDETLTASKFADRASVEFWNKLYCEAGLPCISKSNL
ncbi:juvenile hormone esterase-like isoform X2 [Leguminivora glycinivorella]|uniref:juvenile hormone esterase-like isoform X2 n=1 Tax=Leguminivora glycinivorella TaxID=1035111 RepID=UPI00200CEA67|nr:juvenile hormone esterase-like isoform X2 [Leguminivora glycinivorella]